MDVPTVAADPNDFLALCKNASAAYIVKQLEVARLVLLFDCSDSAEKLRDIRKALGVRLLSHTRVHIRPLVVFTGCRRNEVFLRRGDRAAAQKLEPQLGVLFLVCCGLLENRRYLLIAVLLCLRRKEGVFVRAMLSPANASMRFFSVFVPLSSAIISAPLFFS